LAIVRSLAKSPLQTFVLSDAAQYPQSRSIRPRIEKGVPWRDHPSREKQLSPALRSAQKLSFNHETKHMFKTSDLQKEIRP
jgi:hypothetical protein